MKNGKYKLFLENGEEVLTYDDLILEKDLLLTKEIDFDDLKMLSLETHYYEVYYKMVQKISTKLRSEKEIRNLLEKEDLIQKEKEKVVEKLKRSGLLDEERFKKAFVSDHVHLGMDGPYYIIKQLKEHDIEASLDTSFTEEQWQTFDEKMKNYIEKKIRANAKYSKYVLKQKIVEALTNKGFERNRIIEIFDSYTVDFTSAIQKEYQKIYTKLSKKYEGKELDYKTKQKLLSKGFKMDEIESMNVE